LNILVNNKTNIIQQGRKNGLGATSVKLVNNIIEGGGPAATISGPYTNASWTGNIIFKTNGAGDMPEGSYDMKDPKLKKDNAGIFQLTSENSSFNNGQQKIERIKVKPIFPGDVGASKDNR
jgi:poly(beta-D-mannuronate) lyase